MAQVRQREAVRPAEKAVAQPGLRPSESQQIRPTSPPTSASCSSSRGEALMGEDSYGINRETIERIVAEDRGGRRSWAWRSPS